MKKFSFMLALVLVFAMTGTAMAAQLFSASEDGVLYAKSTPKAVYDQNAGWVSAFNPDGSSNYPYEIYLPNENEPAKYRIHTSYSKNTDACAACHATHTAVGNSLLQWYTVYDTCMACHDGTVSTTYNVEDGEIASTGAVTFGGMFGTGSEASISNHNVSGTLSIAAAPGGSVNQSETVAGAHGATETRWVTEFGCESCHTPHGQGGNARILHPDANYAASYAAKTKADGSYKYYVDNVTGYVYADAAKATEPVYIIKGYPYSPVIKVDGVQNSTLKINNTTGKSVITGAYNVTTIETAVASVSVKMDIDNYLAVNENVTHVSGMNFFCGACHTDYNTKAFTDNGAAELETGVYSKAHRHQMGMNWYYPVSGLKFEASATAYGTMECLTCHVAHGTSDEYWTKTLVGKVDGWSADMLVELAGSSVLKRMPNMATCEACHSKGSGNEGYAANTAQTLAAATSGTQVDAMAAGGGFVGQGTCSTCHTETYKEFQETWHAQKTRPGVTQLVYEQALVDYAANASTSYFGVSALDIINTMNELGKVVTNPINGIEDWTAVNPANINIWSWGKETQYIATKNPVTNKYTRKAEYVEGTGFIDASDSEYTCFTGCHTTGYDVSSLGAPTATTADSVYLTTGWLNKVTAGQKPAFDLGITCEACHGQGGNHIKYPSAKNIVNPSTLSMKKQTIGGDGVTYNSSSTLLNTTAVAKSCASCHNSATHQGDYFMTGYYDLNKNSVQDVGEDSYTASAHYTSGLVSCNTCHDMHKESPTKGQLKTPSAEELCATCHDAALSLNTYMPFIPSSEARRHDFGTALPANTVKLIPADPTVIMP